MTIRWDGNEISNATYFYPVVLEANTIMIFLCCMNTGAMHFFAFYDHRDQYKQ